ncbi:methylenetetrahydrofolate reductase [Acetobacter peroxydans]|uniref:Methylenetetrahydrofolate reductase n=2 Tax=Acetobacter peroxydans TaxID=104098 RepID=A0A4Y3TU83_9PROT|nr:methylenetetrahydrofolate reductase [NAD(P)H] [Acetobacter peroxydans]NHO16696.1 methylenetetrahydrofolate reductase [NAD(P)H] [Acetobacter peroxydans]GBR34354.1 5,10-methylenetetrahydrofolate reductase [Acetobacter peroxydans NBRC 13755]GBR39225.1 5,10-methylenetetrahydrofolate reductase [Acetobacter peroxydans]GEB85402.1 methylenetetrahydrofolate reductase [Acetobacter peroxydans]
MPFLPGAGLSAELLNLGPLGPDLSTRGPEGDVAVSFEFFPPKTDKMAAALHQTAQDLAPLKPRFVSVTYGAGGSTRERTLAATAVLAREAGVPVAGHLTCVNATRAQVDDVARAYWAQGVRHIVALRGDPPGQAGQAPGGRFTPTPGGYDNAAGLVRGLREIAPFEISVAAYPENHPEATSAQADLDNLKAKLDAGATRAITQFFFEAGTFLRFRDRAAAAGITAEIVPGILPIANIEQAYTFAAQCGTHIPLWMRRMFDGLDAQPETRALVTTAVAGELCRQLRAEGVTQFHFYTLNKSAPSAALCRLLGRHPILENVAA